MNYRSFEDRERTMELKSFFFNTLYLWTAAYIFPLVLSFYDFLILFSSSSYVFSLVYFLCTWGYLTLLMISQLIFFKKKKEEEEEDILLKPHSTRPMTYIKTPPSPSATIFRIHNHLL
jgi:hypothetical protein